MARSTWPSPVQEGEKIKNSKSSREITAKMCDFSTMAWFRVVEGWHFYLFLCFWTGRSHLKFWLMPVTSQLAFGHSEGSFCQLLHPFIRSLPQQVRIFVWCCLQHPYRSCVFQRFWGECSWGRPQSKRILIWARVKEEGRHLSEVSAVVCFCLIILIVQRNRFSWSRNPR